MNYYLELGIVTKKSVILLVPSLKFIKFPIINYLVRYHDLSKKCLFMIYRAENDVNIFGDVYLPYFKMSVILYGYGEQYIELNTVKK